MAQTALPERVIPLAEIAQHASEKDCWVVIDGLVYDVTKFLPLHPAGKKILLQHGGKDATDVFKYYHADSVRQKYRKLVIGRTPDGPRKVQSPLRDLGLVKDATDNDIPYAAPSYLQGWQSPFFTESHNALRLAVRDWIQRELVPNATEWDESGNVDAAVYKRAGEQGLLAIMMGKGLGLGTKYFPSRKVCGVEIEKEDAFHEFVVVNEANIIASGGVAGFIWAGITIGLPPILMFGSQAMKDRVAGPCLRGEKRICLAITEPWGGSDVANLKTTARLTEDGKFYVVNGTKKWISNGVFSDYFTTAVRTGGDGMFGVSLLLIEKTMPGVSTRRMKCTSGGASGTTFVIFENVKVPVENLIGEENEGFKSIMFNFNHERLAICMGAIGGARICFEDAFRYAHKRKTFGKPLIEHPVIRQKLAHMARHIESGQALLDQCIYNYETMSDKKKLMLLPGTIALLKSQIGNTLDICAREALQIFGGLGYTRVGQGERVERIYREVRGMVIIGGSEEIMLDLAMKMASRTMPSL